MSHLNYCIRPDSVPDFVLALQSYSCHKSQAIWWECLIIPRLLNTLQWPPFLHRAITKVLTLTYHTIQDLMSLCFFSTLMLYFPFFTLLQLSWCEHSSHHSWTFPVWGFIPAVIPTQTTISYLFMWITPSGTYTNIAFSVKHFSTGSFKIITFSYNKLYLILTGFSPSSLILLIIQQDICYVSHL
jgi:hypothetical protein